MKIDYLWDSNLDKDIMGVRLHPSNKNLIIDIQRESRLAVINPQNERQIYLNYRDVLILESMDNWSKVYTVNGSVFYVKKRLKELEYLTKYKICRINNSVILNLKEITGFKNGKYARLEVVTKDEQIFIVSRHYAKQIREVLS